MSNGYDLNPYKDSSDYGLIEKGKYESVVEKIEIKKSAGGVEYINIQHKLRSDVEQKFKNRVVFETIFKEKENPAFFNRQRLTKLVKACDKEAPMTFGSLEEMLEFIVGKKIIINVNVRHDDFRDEDVNYVAWYEQTEHGDKVLEVLRGMNNPSHQETPKTKKDDFYETSKQLVSDDDLPF